MAFQTVRAFSYPASPGNASAPAQRGLQLFESGYIQSYVVSVDTDHLYAIHDRASISIVACVSLADALQSLSRCRCLPWGALVDSTPD
ncbi:MAG: hypothetical protein IPN24_16720 [Betaproteobacteria bacterium]|nr:hypothetical protein [Betaproteobacteria bacterium]